MKTNLFAIAIDETQYWNADFLQSCGVDKVETVYLVNKNRTVNLCEMLPSYELTPGYYIPTGENVSDEFNSGITDHDAMFVHCNGLDLTGAVKLINHNFWYTDENYYEKIEKVVEELNCNHVI